MSNRVTKQQLSGMLERATRSARAVGALTEAQEFRVYVPWMYQTIVVANVDGSGGVRGVTDKGGTTREIYEQAHALACAFELVEQARR